MPTGSEIYRKNADATTIKEELTSRDQHRQMKAIKQVIAQMITGKDMSMHYNDVAKLLSSPDLRMKKMVYLYLMQNSKSHSQKATLLAGTLMQDTNHPSPLIRGIALRTMSSMLVAAMVDFHAPVLARLRDPDPYVRRNAAFACLKLFTIAPDVCKQTKLFEALEELLGSSTASVVASAVCVINEVITLPNAPVNIQTAVAARALTLLKAMDNCGEWPQLYLMEGVAQLFVQKTPLISLSEAEDIIASVASQLCSGNGAVCMAAIKVIITMLSQFTGSSVLTADEATRLERRYAALVVQPMIRLISTQQFEIRYVAFRNLKLLLNVGPTFVHAFTPHLPSLFVKFDDPIYIKLEKVDTMLTLATHDNARRVLAELSEYATELDEQLARKAIHAICVLAVKVDDIVGGCVDALIAIMNVRSPHIAQESAIGCQLILRQYPNGFEELITKLCGLMDLIVEPESKMAISWVLGEYGDRIDDAAGTLSLFFDTFAEESVSVQLAVLTAVAKTYIKSDEATKAINLAALTEVLGLCKASEVPDVRDRAFFYWRLISTNIKAASMVLLHRPGMLLVDELDQSLLTELLSQAGHLSSIIHKPLDAVIGATLSGGYYDESDEEGDAREEKNRHLDPTEELPTPDLSKPTDTLPSVEYGGAAISPSLPPSTTVASPPPIKVGKPQSPSLSWTTVLDAKTTGKGLAVSMGWSQEADGPQLHTRFQLETSATGTAKVVTMQINVNLFGLGISQAFPETTLKAGDAPVVISLAVGANNQRKPVKDLQVALKVEPIGVLFFVAPPIPMHLVLQPATGCDPTKYAAEFESASVGWQLPADVPPIPTSNGRLSGNALRLLSLNLVHSTSAGSVSIYASTIADQMLYATVKVENGFIASAIIRGSDVHVCPPFGEYLLASLASY